MKLFDVKNVVKLENRNYDELNTMANRIIEENLVDLLDKHINGTKTQQLSAYTALAKKFPEYKSFCYPETFLKENELYVCQENCDFVRRSAFYDMVNNYEEVQDFCKISQDEINTALVFVEWPPKVKSQPPKEEIDKIRETFTNFIDYLKNIKN